MPLDLKRINPGKGAGLTDPRDIFAALPGKPWPRLRPEQGEVLKQWYARRSEQDLVIKQNTGGGKTLVGLLIGQSSMNEGIGRVIYLVPDSYLIRQVVDAANEVGIPVTEDRHDDKFLSGRSILVATFDKLVNGRSTFGVLGLKAVTDLDVVIIDDAHAALASANNQFSASLPADSGGYGELLALFGSDLQRQSPKAYADLVDGDRGTPLRVPPKATEERASEALKILKKYGDDSDIKSLYFSWPLVADHLRFSTMTFTNRAVEIKTPCPQVAMIPAFARARRRVYLTATLADEGVLVTELGAQPEGVRSPITPERASDLGDRIILAPLSINPSLSDTAVREMVREFADGDRNGDATLEADPINVVVLVPSVYAARAWEPYANETVNVKTMRPVIQRLTDGEHVGVVVLINKYDGVDLPDSACRLLVIDGIPTPLAPSEQRESAALTGSRTFAARTVQRIEQGMGRGIRDVEDYCAVLLMTRGAALALRDPKQRQFFSPVTHAQIELSQQIADQIENEGLDEIRNALDVFLERDGDWVASSRAAVADVEYEREGTVTDIAVARRHAFDKAIAGNFEAAVTALRTGIDSLEDPLEKGWYMEELATYQQFVDPVGAQATLAGARERNLGVLKPDTPAPKSTTVRGPEQQASAAAAFLGERYADPTALRLGVGSLFDNIVWAVKGTASMAEEQIRLLGLHLGFASTRPEHEEKSGGPDNLWGLTPSVNAVIELKTENTRDDTRIVKHEAEQLLHSIVWDSQRNSHVTTRIPVLIHPSAELHSLAVLQDGTRIITPDDLAALRLDTQRFADEIASAKSWSDPVAVGAALRRNTLTAERIIPRHSRAFTS
ncbi:DEAD/DEAH box helicase [Rhodococcus wratislaviensis]|uniref:DEAD/DEAH box helicase n=1 Tax=Rhodococcus wratislaviensis TaxID=44752 RepID=UPI00365EA6C0